MSTTDRAFIAALQQGSAPVHVGAPASTEQRFRIDEAITVGLGGPRVNSTETAPAETAPRSAPLSEHLARRRTATLQASVQAPLSPGVEVDAFGWPAVVEALTTSARQELLDILSKATKRGESSETPALALVAARPAVGCTTTVLALARLVASVGGKVALIDAGQSGAAARLGVRRGATLPADASVSVIDDNLVVSRSCSTCLLAAGPAEPGAFASAALDRLIATHDLVLIDGGVAETVNAWPAIAAKHTGAGVLLVDAADGSLDARQAATAWLDAADAPVMGVVETLDGN